MVSIKIEGVEKLQKLLAKPVHKQPVKLAMSRIGQIGADAARAGAPRGRTGRLQGSIKHKVAGNASWVAIVVTAMATPRRPGARGGKTTYPFSYPKKLEFDSKSRHKNWLKRSIERARGAINAATNAAAKEIEREWASGR